MKLTDIMLGDLVRSTDKKQETIRVKDILNFEVDGIVHQGINGSWACFECLGWYECDDIEPIPLTPEILEKNGWKEAQFWHEYQDGKNTIQSCLPDMRGIINGVEIQHFKCEYVHQYQHLLRLCGLDNLADNFKIE